MYANRMDSESILLRSADCAKELEVGGSIDALENVGEQWAEPARDGNQSALGRISLSVATGCRL